MTDGYVERRRQYVAKIRNSFPNENALTGSEETAPVETHTGFFYVKLRFFLAALLFAAFFYCQSSDTKILGHSTTEIFEMITDNQYYTNLKNYVMIQEQIF